ncbi:MAG: DNA polymerase [Methanosphaera sp.]|nr:DNA polymerase [Methanosphaera sp.]
MRRYTADFETNVSEDDCRVWAYAICEIGNPDNFIYGNDIEEFIKWCSNKKQNPTLYFHNLKFDSEYIISYLLNNGYKVIKDKKERESQTFTTVITDMGQFYALEIYFEVGKKKVNKVTIYDSLKLINKSVEDIAKDFNLPINKLNLDYKRIRPKGYELQNYEIRYINHDVKIMALALESLFDEGLTKMTIGSNAISNYRKSVKYFMTYFPCLPIEIDKDIRQSYKGGFTYLNPIHKEKVINNIMVLDVNSLYPSVMVDSLLPHGQPVPFKGEYKPDKFYPLYVIQISCSFELKENMIPTIQIKNSLQFLPNEYIESSDGEIITLTLTNIDYELFLKHYNVIIYEYHGGYKFMGVKGLFTNYINYWTSVKINSKKEGNKSLYQISKLMLNSLYGKFGTNPYVRSKYPYLDEEGIVKYGCYPVEEHKPIYIPVASFITAYARRKTIETSQAIKDYTIKNFNDDYYIYSDTDSIHLKKLPEETLKQFVEIDDFELGKWKIESDNIKIAKFLRQKCYIEIDENDYKNVTVAGLPKRLAKYVTIDNFKEGFSILKNENDKEHKLTYKHVKGGVLLVDTDFSIKYNDNKKGSAKNERFNTINS